MLMIEKKKRTSANTSSITKYKAKNNKTTGIKTKQKWKEYDTVTNIK